MKLYCAANNSSIAYSLEDGGSKFQEISNIPHLQAQYLAIAYGLTEYYNKWSKVLDSRAYDLDSETRDFYKVSSDISAHTAGSFPRPILVCTSSHAVERHLNLRHIVPNNRIQKLAETIYKMIENTEVKFEYVRIKDNEAVKLLI